MHMDKKRPLSTLLPLELETEVKDMINNSTEYSNNEFIDALLLLSLNPISYELADNLASLCIDSNDRWVKNMALMSVGHIARVYRKRVNQALYDKVVETFLKEKDPFWKEGALDALNDVEMFLKIPLPTDSS